MLIKQSTVYLTKDIHNLAKFTGGIRFMDEDNTSVWVPDSVIKTLYNYLSKESNEHNTTKS